MLECLSMSIAGAAGGFVYVLYRDWRDEEVTPVAQANRVGFARWLRHSGRTTLIGAIGGFVVWGTGGATDIGSQAAVPARLVAALAVGAAGPHYVLSLIQKSRAQELQASNTRTVDEVALKTQASLEQILEQLQAAASVQSSEGGSDVSDTADNRGDQTASGATGERSPA